MKFNHTSVLLKETIEGLNIDPDGIYVDGTLGGGGHSLEIVKQLKNGFLIGIDQDKRAIEEAKIVLGKYASKVEFINDNFSNLQKILFDLNIEGINGIILDLGVSSYQLDEKSRGFSYNTNSDLDMRMDRSDKLTAKEIVNTYSLEELDHIFKSYGEERWSKRIAEFIVEERNKKSLETTFELVEVIKKAIPAGARRNGPHPARRVFQAIRIEVNNELNILEGTIKDASRVMYTGGRICIISFHSLEDRIVKETFKELYKDCICPSNFPICSCDKEREIKIITRKPIVASAEEVERNSRSRSAKLRVAEKI